MSTRREFLTTTGTAVAAATAATLVGAATPTKAAVTSPTASASAAGANAAGTGAGKDPYAEVVETSAACIRTGEGCVAHCNDELGRGNTAMANCNKRVHEMLAMVQAMLTLASSKSEFAKRHAANCADACKACAAACLEHKEHWGHGMHLPCKACYEACLACESSCRKLQAA